MIPPKSINKHPKISSPLKFWFKINHPPRAAKIASVLNIKAECDGGAFL